MKKKKFIIVDGAFTKGKGNFTGYSTTGERVHIFKRQMESRGMDTQEKVKFPFFVIAEEKDYDAQLDANGNVVTKAIVGRMTASVVFTNKQDFVNAHVEENNLEEEIKLASEKAAADLRKSYGLTQESVTELQKASI